MLHVRFDRRHFLRLGAALPFMGTAHAKDTAPAKSVILVFLGGGLSHHDSFDPKPDMGEEIRGKYGVIKSNVNGLILSDKLPLLAKVMDKVALVRSCSHTNDHHETATNWVMSGRFGSAFGDYPAVGAVAAHHFGFRGTLPPYVSIPKNPSFTWELGKSAFLGGRYESFRAGDPNAENYKVPDLAGSISERKQTLRQAVDGLAKRIEHNDHIATFDEFQQRAAAMVLSKDARAAFAIETEDAKLRDRYGRTTAGQSLLLARRMVEAGVKFVTVNYGGWDHHALIFKSLDKKLPELDQGLSALIDDMDTRGTLKDTLLVVMGEFGRSPKVNKEAGRDHWGPAASMLFAGAGAGRGVVIGKTDAQGGSPTTVPVTPADVAHTILDRLGIDPRKTLTTPEGRPVEVLDSGRTIEGLWS